MDILFDEFKSTSSYKSFIDINSGVGNLKIRAYTASLALPVSGLDVVVSTKYDGMNIIFFRGKTDASGMIENIKLPAPVLGNNLVIPNTIEYTVSAGGNKYFVNMYDGICVVQNINNVLGDNNGN